MRLKTILNWSGGKDSALSLFKLQKDSHYEITCLLSSISQQHQRISMHGVRVELLEMQAAQLGIPLYKMEVPDMPSMDVYEEVVQKTLEHLKTKGNVASAYGDIFLEDLRQYRDNMLYKLILEGVYPLWKQDTKNLIREFIDLGFKTIVSCVNDKYLDVSFAGRVIDEDFLKDLPKNVDPCGENGEFHTFVFDGPIFQKAIPLITGEKVYRRYNAPMDIAESNEQESHPNPKSNDPTALGFWYCDLIPVID